MSTHRRAWIVRAGIIATVALTGLLALAAPATAANPVVTITSLSSGSLQAGESATLKFTVKNTNNSPDGETSATIKISFSGFQSGEISCQGNCDFTQAIPTGQTSSEFTATIKAGTVPAGQTRNGSVHIRVSIGNGNTADVPRDISVEGAAQQATQTVPEVSGTVVDVYTGTGIEAAKVYMQDSASHEFTVGTDKSGNFKFVSTQAAPIAPGTLAIKVEKDGITPYLKSAQANPNQPLTGLRLTVTPLASASASAPAPGGAVDGVTPEVSQLQSDSANTPVGDQSSGGGLSWALIAVGAVLVALGVGAIVLLFVRKKNEEDPDGEDPRNSRKGGPPPGQGPPGLGVPRPPQQRRGGPPDMGPRGGGPGYDPTRPMRPPVSPGPRGDQTMIAPSPLANAPTQLHGRIPPEHADPYGAPPRHNGGQPGYGPGPGPGPGPGGPYGAAGAGTYGQPANPPTVAYPGGAPTYGQGSEYGQPGYGQAYGQGTQPDPYGPSYGQGPQQGPGYGGGYDQRGPRPAPPPPPPQPDPRRVDWLDD